MGEVLALIIFVGSGMGMLILIFPKIPLLRALPERGEKFPPFEQIKRKVRRNTFFSSFSLEKTLQKFLLRIKILSLKFENKISDWLSQLRERKKEQEEIDDYWEKIRKATKQKKKRFLKPR